MRRLLLSLVTAAMAVTSCGTETGGGSDTRATREAAIGAPTGAATSAATGAATGAVTGGVAGGVVVRTDAGRVRGVEAGNFRIFRGIPYAAPPVGELRWKAPQPPHPWTGVRDATRFGSLCPQLPSSYANVSSTTEDCLVLNVTVPRSAPKHGPRPVMVWVHGDGAIGGGEFFDARRLAGAGDAVLVTVNYRLGVFGAFGFPGLAGSGTYGLRDQQAALRWVRANAAAFGGDPRNVTLFGESFGGQSTSAHLVAPSSKGLFDRAIVQSGFPMMDLPAGAMPGIPAQPWFGWRPLKVVRQLGTMVAGKLGCADVACLRKLPVRKLLEYPQIGNLFQSYAYDSDLLPEVPAKALRAGRFNHVPVLAGANRDEHRLFVGIFHDLAGKPVTTREYGELLRSAFGKNADRVLARYPLKDYDSPSLAWAAVMTDRMWATATHAQNKLYATYAYEFADRKAPMFLPFPKSFPPGAYHAAELPYLFAEAKVDGQLTKGQRELSDRMVRSWTSFARTGDPGWPRFDGGAHVEVLEPGVSGKSVDYAAEHRLDFWARLPGNRHS